MTPAIRLAFAACIATVTFASAALAQPDEEPTDHLQCYRVADPFAFRGRVDLAGPQFGVDESCRIRVKSLRFCRPVSKSVLRLGPAAPPLGDVPGQPLENDYLCYKVACPRELITDRTVTDQFGTRTLSFQRRHDGEGRLRAQLLCTPAFKEEVTTTTQPPQTTTTMEPTTTTLPPPTTTVPATCGGPGPTCGGACPSGEECFFSEAFDGCHCAPEPCTGFCFCITNNPCEVPDDCRPPTQGNCLPGAQRCHGQSCTSHANCPAGQPCADITPFLQ